MFSLYNQAVTKNNDNQYNNSKDYLHTHAHTHTHTHTPFPSSSSLKSSSAPWRKISLTSCLVSESFFSAPRPLWITSSVNIIFCLHTYIRTEITVRENVQSIQYLKVINQDMCKKQILNQCMINYWYFYDTASPSPFLALLFKF